MVSEVIGSITTEIYMSDLGPFQITCDVELYQPLDEIIGNGFLEVIENFPNACNHLFMKILEHRKSDNYRFFI